MVLDLDGFPIAYAGSLASPESAPMLADAARKLKNLIDDSDKVRDRGETSDTLMSLNSRKSTNHNAQVNPHRILRIDIGDGRYILVQPLPGDVKDSLDLILAIWK